MATKTVDRLPPKIKEAMASRPYQLDAVAFGIEHGTFGLFDEPGLGKTIETLATVYLQNPSGGTHLIVAPKIAAYVWQLEIQRWLGSGVQVFVAQGTRARREKILGDAYSSTYPGHKFVIVNHRMPMDYPHLQSRRWTTVVVDEAHSVLCTSNNSKRSNTAKAIIRCRADRRIALTGTPFRGQHHSVWGILNWLDPKRFSSFWRFVGEYYTVASDGFSDYVIGPLRRHGLDDMAEDISTVSIRRTKGEVLKELPPKMYAGQPRDGEGPVGVWLPLEGKQKRQYETFLKEGTLVLDGGELWSNSAIEDYTRRKQLCCAPVRCEDGKIIPLAEGAKFEWLLEKIEDLGIPAEGRLVVTSQFSVLLNVWSEALQRKGIPTHCLTGATTLKQRVKMIEDFQSDDPCARVFLLNMKAGGVAVTLDMADDLVIVDETTVPADIIQVEDRIHRTSRMHSVTIHTLRLAETQDEEIAWVLASGSDVQSYILDGSRGISVAKKLYQSKRD